MTYFIFDPDTGQILRKEFRPARSDMAAIYPEGNFLPIPDDFTMDRFFVEPRSKTLMEKGTFPPLDRSRIQADGQDTTTISPIPRGTRVIWFDGRSELVNDGSIEFSTDMPGTYPLWLSHIHYQDTAYTVIAEALT